ncbi:hypothetical protein ACQEVC_10755 [Plantactinospora sp. CA-294935]|uniref:hypothetical protein n=1 Tax=Plantactinospora sp. CA-294935 TaxID=3240012 RepID=UPI003D8F9624
MATAHTVLPAHRLLLSAPEWALLLHASGLRPPPGFAPADPPTDQPPETATALADRGIVTTDPDNPTGYRPVAPVATNLATLGAARAIVQLEVTTGNRGTRAVIAVAGNVGSGLIALDDGGVELSMFASVTLAAELIRAVPPAHELAGPRATLLDQALGGARGGRELVGRLPLAALAEYGQAGDLAGASGRQQVVSALGLTAAQAWLAEQVNSRTVGVLRAVVTGRVGDAVGVGQVVWLATDDGWLGLRPVPDGSGRRMVVLESVGREDIGVWLAPYLAQILADADE